MPGWAQLPDPPPVPGVTQADRPPLLPTGDGKTDKSGHKRQNLAVRTDSGLSLTDNAAPGLDASAYSQAPSTIYKYQFLINFRTHYWRENGRN